MVKILIAALFMFVFWLQFSSACHNKSHQKETSINPDGSRRKRRQVGLPGTNDTDTNTTTITTNVTIQTFFPPCMQEQLAPSAYQARSWVGPINYALFHSRWYDRMNASVCTGDNDTVECWAENIGSFIRRQSPAFRAAQECIIQYYESYHEVDYELEEYPEGTDFEDDESCEDVDLEEYETEFTSEFNPTDLDEEDLTFTDLDDLLEFAQQDMICVDCTCEDLEENDEFFEEYDFEDETLSCGACWYTRLATEITDDSDFKKTTSKLALTKGGLKKKSLCPEVQVDFSNLNSVMEILGINVTCGPINVEIRMESCGLVDMGYLMADEIFINDPTSDEIPDEIDPECLPKLVKRDSKNDKVVEFKFRLSRCDGSLHENDTHHWYTYSIQNRNVEDIYATEIVDQHVGLDINVTCVYANTLLTLPFEIVAITQTMTYNIPDETSPFEMTIAAYRDENFTQPFTSENPIINIPDYIWIQLTHNSEDNLASHFDSCWATPTDDSEDPNKIYLIYLGCSVKEGNDTGLLDAAQDLNTCAENNSSFRFRSFSFAGFPLHVFCDVEAHRENSVFCDEHECPDGGTGKRRRRKRSMKNPNLAHFNLKLATTPPTCSQGTCQHISFGCDGEGRPVCGCLSGYSLNTDGTTCERENS